MDPYRDAAYTAVRDFLTNNRTNAIGAGYVWRAVNEALDAYDDEFIRSAEVRLEWCVMLGPQPMIAVPTRRIAKQQMKLMRRTSDHPRGPWHLRRVQVGYDHH